MGRWILSVPPLGWAVPPVPNWNHLLRRMPTAKSTEGKRVRASPNLMGCRQGMKVKHLLMFTIALILCSQGICVMVMVLDPWGNP